MNLCKIFLKHKLEALTNPMNISIIQINDDNNYINITTTTTWTLIESLIYLRRIFNWNTSQMIMMVMISLNELILHVLFGSMIFAQMAIAHLAVAQIVVAHIDYCSHRLLHTRTITHTSAKKLLMFCRQVHDVNRKLWGSFVTVKSIVTDSIHPCSTENLQRATFAFPSRWLNQ